MAARRALTVAFVGVDGSGKSTLVERVASWLREDGRSVHAVKIRSGRSGLDRQAGEQGHGDLAGMVGAETAMMMLGAITWQSLRDVKPLRRDPSAVVLLDRSTECVLALAQLSAPATVAPLRETFRGLPHPDLAVLVSVDADVAIGRLAARGGTEQTPGFLRAFQAAYRSLPEAAEFAEIDGNATPDEMLAAAQRLLTPLLRPTT